MTKKDYAGIGVMFKKWFLFEMFWIIDRIFIEVWFYIYIWIAYKIE